MIAALALAIAAVASPAGAQTTDCGAAPTQMEATRCADAAARAADVDLNAVWAKAVAAVRGTPAAAPLQQAQRAWISYRDLACGAEAARYEGGSIAPMIRASCIERLTRARAADLALLLEN